MHGQRRVADAPRAALLTTPTSRRGSNQQMTIERTASEAVERATRSVAHPVRSPSTSAENAVVKKKVDEILKRMLPRSIIQSYAKVAAALKTQVMVAVNGELLQTIERDTGPLRAHWKAHQAPLEWKPTAPLHPFHCARSVQYATPHPELTLSESLKTLEVPVTSLATGTTVHWFQSVPPVLTKKAWKFIAETDRKIGLALYELPLGPWKASSMVVLVWAKKLEVINIYLQLHVAELLYGCPTRVIRIPPDDVDTRYGLHSFTVAVTIRDFARVLWETECYSVEFPPPQDSNDTVSVGLLDGENGYRDRGRFISSPIGTAVVTDAISIDVDSAIMVDLTVWEASCQPVWAFSKLLPITKREAPREATDFSLSVAGDKRQLCEITFRDEASGNLLCIHLEKPSTSSTIKNKSVFVKQITLELAIAFVNKTFSTNYPMHTKR